MDFCLFVRWLCNAFVIITNDAGSQLSLFQSRKLLSENELGLFDKYAQDQAVNNASSNPEYPQII